MVVVKASVMRSDDGIALSCPFEFGNAPHSTRHYRVLIDWTVLYFVENGLLEGYNVIAAGLCGLAVRFHPQ